MIMRNLDEYMNKSRICLKKRLMALLLLPLVCFACVSCSSNAGREKLDNADALIDEYPDSALTILNSMDDSFRKSSSDKARYSLLLAFATIKTRGLDNVTKADIDSIFSPAYKYYGAKTKPSRETMLCHYVNALVQDSDEVRIREYDRTIELAAGERQSDYKALSWLNKAAIYYNAASSEDELECVDSALSYLDKVKRVELKAFVNEAAGRAHMAIEEDALAEKYYEQYLNIAQSLGDSALINNAKLHLGAVYSFQKRYDESVKIFDELTSSTSASPIFESSDLCSYAMSLSEMKRYDDAKALMAILKQESDPANKLSYFVALGRLCQLQGNYKDAYMCRDSMTYYGNMITLQKMKYNLPRKEKDMEKRLAELSLLRHKDEMVIYRLVAVVGLLVLITVIVLLAFINQNRRLKIRNLENELLEREKKDNDFKNQIAELYRKKENLENELLVKEKEMHSSTGQLEDKITQLKKAKSENFLGLVRAEARLCNKLIRSSVKEKNNQAKLMVEKYRDKGLQSKIENMINENSDDILNFIAGKALLSDEGLLLVMYDICGFDYVSMGALFNINTSSASARKSRVKQKLMEILDDSNRSRLTSYLPMLN